MMEIQKNEIFFFSNEEISMHRYIQVIETQPCLVLRDFEKTKTGVCLSKSKPMFKHMSGLFKTKQLYAGEIPDDVRISELEFKKGIAKGNMRRLSGVEERDALLMINSHYGEILSRGFKPPMGMWILEQVFYSQ